jgi:hypothetical protein
MTKSNLSATLSTSNLYEHPWFNQLKLLDNTTACESQSQQKPKSETPGQKYTNCIHCGHKPPKPNWNSRTKSWVHNTSCKACMNFWTRHRFRLTHQDREFLNNNSFCQICGATKNLHIDHCHTTNKIRGYLCGVHNKGIGCFGDNIEHLTAAINYLNSHNGNQI